MDNMIEFPKTEKNGIDFLFQGICPGMIPPNDPEDDAIDDFFEEIESLFHAVETGQIPAAEAAGILISRLAGNIILNG
jgi:hypothetical protein